MKKLLRLFAFAFLVSLASFSNAQSIQAQRVLESAARTDATVNSATQNNNSWRSAHIIIVTSAFTAGTYTPHVPGMDPVSGTFYDILVGAAIAGTGTVVLKVGPGITPAANLAVSDMLPKIWRVQMVGAAGQSMTFSIGALLGI
jgi:hypothetical protein